MEKKTTRDHGMMPFSELEAILNRLGMSDAEADKALGYTSAMHNYRARGVVPRRVIIAAELLEDRLTRKDGFPCAVVVSVGTPDALALLDLLADMMPGIRSVNRLT